ncbi:hypothetical protein DPMN_120287 [Dreissena polymorpha]|uniref:Uncharacterized protein n=1 Tax=Dreissena polymorpha TaxID=45954 RepID=A0A9D4GJH0_DREPO|nr:hypothetical protein DPMN_120287 [Dreissena polymorpha]
MGMSNAERQRKYRLLRDLNYDRRQEYLQKCKDKYKDDKAVGKKKNVKDMTDRERDGVLEKNEELRRELPGKRRNKAKTF